MTKQISEATKVHDTAIVVVWDAEFSGFPFSEVVGISAGLTMKKNINSTGVHSLRFKRWNKKSTDNNNKKKTTIE